ncbi:hypothetical protein MBLNU459_g4169t1 [Dothideomycetes sp. NU459]
MTSNYMESRRLPDSTESDASPTRNTSSLRNASSDVARNTSQEPNREESQNYLDEQVDDNVITELHIAPDVLEEFKRMTQLWAGLNRSRLNARHSSVNIDEDGQRGDPEDDEPLPPYTAIEARKKYIDAYEKCIENLIKVFFQDEEPSKTMEGVPFDRVAEHTAMIIETMEPAILDGIVRGNLAARVHTEPELKEVIEELEDAGLHLPGIYGNFLVNRKGVALSVSDTYEASQLARRYYGRARGDLKMAFEIDLAMSPRVAPADSENGVRKYLCPSLTEPTFHPGRAEKLAVFCDALERCCKSIPRDAWNEPMPHPLCEFGYGKFPASRITDHATHSSSNFIMNLFDAICRVNFEGYKIKGYNLYSIPAPYLISLSEIFVTRIGQGYASGGGGFSYALAGDVDSSANDVPTVDWMLVGNTRAYIAEREKDKKKRKIVKEYIESLRVARKMARRKPTPEEQREIDKVHEAIRKVGILVDRIKGIKDDRLGTPPPEE